MKGQTMKIENIAAMLGCTVEQAKNLYWKNAQGMREMARKAAAHKTGKHNGYTEKQLLDKAATYEALSK
jgi:uncharacterized protein YjcR